MIRRGGRDACDVLRDVDRVEPYLRIASGITDVEITPLMNASIASKSRPRMTRSSPR